MLALLDWAFMVFHTSIIVFNLTGWLFSATRFANLVLLLLTAGSWFLLGLWFGIGYCPCTDWHWMVLRARGFSDLPDSYIDFLIQRTTGLRFNPDYIDLVTVTLFFLALAASIVVNVAAWSRGRRSTLD